MKHYKVCKYNYSDDNYSNEWTSIWDFIDPDTNDGEITEEYRSKERDYINFALSLLNKFEFDKFHYADLQDNHEAFGKSLCQLVAENLLTDLGKSPKQFNGNSIDYSSVISLLRLSLRHVVWFKLLHDQGYYLSFGTDYYWLIGAPDSLNVEVIAKDNGLFAYETSDPWE